MSATATWVGSLATLAAALIAAITLLQKEDSGEKQKLVANIINSQFKNGSLETQVALVNEGGVAEYIATSNIHYSICEDLSRSFTSPLSEKKNTIINSKEAKTINYGSPIRQLLSEQAISITKYFSAGSKEATKRTREQCNAQDGTLYAFLEFTVRNTHGGILSTRSEKIILNVEGITVFPKVIPQTPVFLIDET